MKHWSRMVELVRGGLGLSTSVVPLRADEEAVWRLARKHKVAAILAPNILKQEKPAQLVEEARYVWQMAALREAYYVREAEKWIEKLSEVSIHSYPLKGVVLAKEVYPLRGQRAFRDLDLLIAREDVERAHGFFLDQGFKEIHPHSPLKRAARIHGSSLRASELGLDAVSYERDDLFLEIHTRIVPPNLGEYPLQHYFLEEGPKALDAVDFAAHLLFHTTRHHFLYGLRHLVDILLWFRKKEVETEELERRLERSGLSYLAVPAWQITHETFPDFVTSPPKVQHSRWTERYVRSVRAHLEEMPERAIGLSGSPLPFYFMKKEKGEGLWETFLGSRDKMTHQTGHQGWSLKNIAWRLARPFQLLWRHGPVVFRWILFARFRST